MAKKRKRKQRHIDPYLEAALTIMFFVFLLFAFGALKNIGYIIGNYALKYESSTTYVGRCISYEKIDDPPSRYQTDKTYFILHLDNGVSVGIYRPILNLDKLSESKKEDLFNHTFEFRYIPVHAFPFDDQTTLLLSMESQKQEYVVESQVRSEYREKFSGWLPILLIFSSIALLVVIIPFTAKCISRHRKKAEKIARKKKKMLRAEEANQKKP